MTHGDTVQPGDEDSVRLLALIDHVIDYYNGPGLWVT